MSSNLRTQFLNYMTLQRFSPHTQRNYIAAVKGLAGFYKKSPDLLTNDQMQDYINKRFINCCPTSRHKTTYTKIKC